MTGIPCHVPCLEHTAQGSGDDRHTVPRSVPGAYRPRTWRGQNASHSSASSLNEQVKPQRTVERDLVWLKLVDAELTIAVISIAPYLTDMGATWRFHVGVESSKRIIL